MQTGKNLLFQMDEKAEKLDSDAYLDGLTSGK
jgi:hypothetical protein